MLPTVYVEAERAHQFGKRECRGELSELRRLKAQRTENYPRVGAFDVVRVEYRGEQQQQKYAVDDV